MRLGFVGNSALAFDGDEYWYCSGEWRYLERVAELFDSVDVCAYVTGSGACSGVPEERFRRQLRVPNARVHDLLQDKGARAGELAWLGKQITTLSVLRRLSRNWDFAFIMTPGWPAFFSWWLHKWDGWPYAVSARLDWAGAINYRSSRPPWLRLVLTPYTRLAELVEYRLLRDADIRMTSGRLLLDRCPEFAESSLLTLNVDLTPDCFRIHKDTCRNQGSIRLIYVGKLARRKAVDVLIRAVASLRDLGQHLELHIVGEGPDRSKLESLSRRLSVEAHIVFHGYVGDREALLDRMHDSDIFVIASRSEGFPRVIYEAMSQGLPVIATKVGGIPGLLNDGETALLVPPGDVESLAAAIHCLIENDSLRQALIRAGYDLAYEIVDSDPLHEAFDEFSREIDNLKASRC